MKISKIHNIILYMGFIMLVAISVYQQQFTFTALNISNSFIEQIYFLIASLAVSSILAPIIEEVFYRGFLTFKNNKNLATISLITLTLDFIIKIHDQINIYLNLPYSVGNILIIKLGFLPEIANYVLFRTFGVFYILLAIMVIKFFSVRLNIYYDRIKSNELYIINILILSTFLFAFSHILAINNWFNLVIYIMFGLYLSFVTYYFSIKLSIFTHSLINFIIMISTPKFFVYIINSYGLLIIYSIFSYFLLVSIKKELNKLALNS